MDVVSPEYALEKLNGAIDCLVGLGSAQERLRSAFLCMHTITGKSLGDSDLDETLTRIVDQCTHVTGDPHRGTVGATCAAMTDGKALDIIREVAFLQTEVARLRWSTK